VAVIDTGIGIRYEDQDKLFKLFGFVQDGMQLNTKGIGLGLVIADNIVSQYGGKITFHSEPGQGSTFTFQFKLESEGTDSFVLSPTDPLGSTMAAYNEEMGVLSLGRNVEINCDNLHYMWVPFELTTPNSISRKISRHLSLERNKGSTMSLLTLKSVRYVD